jgi:hypothetical protein
VRTTEPVGFIAGFECAAKPTVAQGRLGAQYWNWKKHAAPLIPSPAFIVRGTEEGHMRTQNFTAFDAARVTANSASGAQTNSRSQLLLLNAPLATTDGCFVVRTVSIGLARRIARTREIISAIGHEATALVATRDLLVPCPVRRVAVEQRAGQFALVFSLAQRLAATRELDVKEIDEVGYRWRLFWRIR